VTTRWTEADFESLSWHDDHVHAIGMANFNEDEGTCDLVMAIDHILDASFPVAPAKLTFHGVFGLRMELDYARVTAGMTPFSIGSIEREPTAYQSFRWKIQINWPAGEITFEAPRFTMELADDGAISRDQKLH